MNILGLTGIGRKSDEPSPPSSIGTPEEPIYIRTLRPEVLDAAGVKVEYWPTPHFVKTGSAAEQSRRDRLAHLNKKGKLGDDIDPDLLLPAPSRQQRRARQRAQAGEHRKMQRNYTRRQLRLEREASDLANLFDIVDRKVPASPIVRNRAQGRILARVAAIREADQARYDSEWDKRRADFEIGTGDVPAPVISHDMAWQQLRSSLKAVQFTQKKPRVKRYDNGGTLEPGLTVAINRTGVDELVAAGGYIPHEPSPN